MTTEQTMTMDPWDEAAESLVNRLRAGSDAGSLLARMRATGLDSPSEAAWAVQREEQEAEDLTLTGSLRLGLSSHELLRSRLAEDPASAARLIVALDDDDDGAGERRAARCGLVIERLKEAIGAAAAGASRHLASAAGSVLIDAEAAGVPLSEWDLRLTIERRS